MPLCSPAATGTSFVSAIFALLSPPLPPDSPPLLTSAEPSVQTLRQREEGGARAQGREGMGLCLCSLGLRAIAVKRGKNAEG